MVDNLNKAKGKQQNFVNAADGAAAAAAAAAVADADADADTATPPAINDTIPQPISHILGWEKYGTKYLSSDCILDVYKVSAAFRAEFLKKIAFSAGGRI
mmetsp:Transcript_3790/g.9069  ORF Transcript_3790/g.9069 Transcript_3790/m.9069 type:complete len:100 (-) Transcript_3790:1174-1473(-)